MEHGAVFTAHRSTMLAAAFHITGSRHDAEDVVQDAWETWSRVDLATVRKPHAFLSVMVSRLALNAVRAQRRRRENYPGPWLPDPVVAGDSPEWEVLHRDGLGQALDFVLSTLTPEQAAAYVLRKVLDVDYPSVAEVLETTPAAARQLVSRAQRAVTSAIGDSLPDQGNHDAQALAKLAEAVLSGEIGRVAALLAPDAVLYSDGGGKVLAARKPLFGPDRIAQFLIGISTMEEVTIVPAVINGGAGAVFLREGAVTMTATVRAGEAGVSTLCFVRNPDKLAAVTLG
ncbi:sigma factor [Amycolatopsis sp. GA6-003]|uniref:sigma factor n=1 Tax=Amycolatopsis sp. GA6-003 TaxID=2652444 RepID=UPI003916CE9E